MGRRSLVLVLAAAGAAGAGAAVVPALAADGSVIASGSSFNPATVTIAVGEKVTWTNGGGTHNVHFEDGSFDQPATASDTWSEPVQRTFQTAGEYRYYCELHGEPGLVGMSGRVVVTAAAEPTAAPAPAVPAPVTPAPEVAPAPSPGPPPQATGFSVRKVGLACARRGGRCRRAGVLLEIDLEGSEDAVIEGRLSRRPLRGTGASRRFGTVRFTARPGRRRVRLSRTTTGRSLAAGRYVLDLAPADGPGPERRLRFRVLSR